jgi:hypothetical protein
VSSETENPLGPPPWLNAPPVEAYPFEDTHDLRKGPDLHPALLGLLPFIGLWRGRGQGGFPAPEDFDFAQEVRISHDGRPFLAYESRLFGIVDGALLYAHEMSGMGKTLAPHLSARLLRVGG